jgi:hypothetical protein
LVQLLKYGDRDDHVVLGKVHDGVVGVEDYGSVQYKNFPVFIGFGFRHRQEQKRGECF